MWNNQLSGEKRFGFAIFLDFCGIGPPPTAGLKLPTGHPSAQTWEGTCTVRLLCRYGLASGHPCILDTSPSLTVLFIILECPWGLSPSPIPAFPSQPRPSSSPAWTTGTASSLFSLPAHPPHSPLSPLTQLREPSSTVTSWPHVAHPRSPSKP